MMYSFGARRDFTVMDEPFYAAYLAGSGADHPMRDAILASQPNDPVAVAAQCAAPVATPHLYMKHMPHHMLEGFPLDWAQDCVNVHLIRHPARVIASYAAKREAPTLEDIGFVQQRALYQKLGGIVIDSTDIRADPERMLRTLCAAIVLPFDPAMLAWPVGPRAEDGVWAQHWYGAVHKSTGFAGGEGELPRFEGSLRDLLDLALPFYTALSEMKIG